MQHTDPELFKQMVDNFGVEEACKQRFRGTGRTFRDVLEIAKRVSAGERIHIIGPTPRTQETLRQVRMLFDMWSVPSVHNINRTEMTVNEGRVTSYTPESNMRGIRSTEYKLHDY